MKAFAEKTETNAIAVRSRYRSLKNQCGEKVKPNISRAISLSSDLRELNREVTEEDLSITIFNGLTSKYRPVLLALQTSSLPSIVDRVRTTLQCSVQHTEQEPKALKTGGRNGKKKKSRKKHESGRITCWICDEEVHVKANSPNKEASPSTRMKKNSHCTPTAFMAAKKDFDVVKGDWVVDSGASQHMSGNRHWFEDTLSLIGESKVFTASGALRTE